MVQLNISRTDNVRQTKLVDKNMAEIETLSIVTHMARQMKYLKKIRNLNKNSN